jgi:putative membrane protein
LLWLLREGTPTYLLLHGKASRKDAAMMYDGWMWGNGWGWGGWVLICVVMVVFWAGVITAIVLAIRYLVGSGGASGGSPRYKPPRPEDVLAGRFARGEIDEDEYRQRITLLHEHR